MPHTSLWDVAIVECVPAVATQQLEQHGQYIHTHDTQLAIDTIHSIWFIKLLYLQPIQPSNATRRRQPKRFNPPLKKDASSSQPSTSQDNIPPSQREAVAGTSTHTTITDEAGNIDGSTVSGVKPSRTRRKGTEKFQPPQHKVQRPQRGRKRGKEAVDNKSSIVAEPDAIEDGQEIKTSDTSGIKQANKRTKKLEKEEARQMDFTSAEPEDLECSQPVDSKEEGAEESNEAEQAEEWSQRAHTVLSYCDESHYAGRSTHTEYTMDTNEQEECVNPRPESGEDIEDSLLLDMVTCDVDMQHNSSPFNLETEPCIHMSSGKDGEPMEVNDLCLQSGYSQESESDAEQSGIPRRQFKAPRSRPCAYNFSILQPKLNTTSSKKKPGQRKRVRVDESHNVSIPVVHGEKGSVFDFQPSQEPTTKDTTMEDVCAGKEEKGSGKNKLNQSRSKMADASFSTRTREEQVSCLPYFPHDLQLWCHIPRPCLLLVLISCCMYFAYCM